VTAIRLPWLTAVPRAVRSRLPFWIRTVLSVVVGPRNSNAAALG
jgi:hypothetical protein